MGYVLLTGATGLLGTYLVRDWLRAGVQLALLARPTRHASARQRVESLVQHWEKQYGYALPRPVVLEGHLQGGDLGLGDDGLRWASANCEAVVHNAASLTFYGEDGPAGEPWKSNLEGTKNLLEFCRRTKIRDFHHVSTAYVCGQRRGRILESDLDASHGFGNDYENSKLQAEQLVRGAEFLKSLTVYRPGIIFGDSQTGYTTTYHGFYVPLKLVSTLLNKIASFGMPMEQLREEVELGGKRLLEVMNLSGNEHKNFVPVDWVSAAMSQLFLDSRHHGRTYHITPRNRTTVATVQDIFQRVSLDYVKPAPQKGDLDDWNEFEKFFFEQMGVYRAYWQDDPEFDDTNTVTALPETICPEVDEAMLMRASRYAVEANFGWPRPPMVKPDFDVHGHLDDLLSNRLFSNRNGAAGNEPARNGRAAHLGLQVNGRGGGQWELLLKDGQVVSAGHGIGERCTATFYLNSKTFEGLAAREFSAAQAIGTGRVVIEGNGVPLDQLTQALQVVAERSFASLQEVPSA